MNGFSSNLCIFHPGALGDGLLSLNAVRTLKRQFPDHEVIWFGHKKLGEVFVACQEVSQAYSFDDIHFLHSVKPGSLRMGRFPDLFSRCERAIGWMDDSGGTWESYCQKAGIETTIFRSPHDPMLHAYRMCDRYLETVDPWLVGKNDKTECEENVHDEVPLTFPNVGNGNKFDSSQGPLIMLHPGSGSSCKCTPPDILVSLARALMADRRRRLCLVGGPADVEALGRVKTLLGSDEVTVLQDMDLVDLSRYLTQAHLFIGHDSGLSHFAACLGIPSLLLFGPTDPSRWAPRGKHVAVMRNVCHCQGEEAIRHCEDKPCFSFSLDDALMKAEHLLSRQPGFGRLVFSWDT